ncbi:hypothetical protein D9M68_723150 [compost metagenome]
MVLQTNGLFRRVFRELDLPQEFGVHDAGRFREEGLAGLVQHLAVSGPAHGEKLLVRHQVVKLDEYVVRGALVARRDLLHVGADACQHASLLAKAFEVRMRVVTLMQLREDR